MVPDVCIHFSFSVKHRIFRDYFSVIGKEQFSYKSVIPYHSMDIVLSEYTSISSLRIDVAMSLSSHPSVSLQDRIPWGVPPFIIPKQRFCDQAYQSIGCVPDRLYIFFIRLHQIPSSIQFSEVCPYHHLDRAVFTDKAVR